MTTTVFQNSLPMLKMYSTRNVNCRFSVLAVNFGRQPRLELSVKSLGKYLYTYIYFFVMTFFFIAIDTCQTVNIRSKIET